jgi:hypothetical protein
MKITKEIFEKSFFSIGGGFDIQPLIRFSHICDFFINVNLFIEKEEAIEWYDKAFKYCNDIVVIDKQVIDEFDETDFFELNENYLSHLTNPDFISREDIINYQNTFQQASALKQYAIIYKLYRKSVDRTLIFYYCTAEGLASYISLSQNGKYAPAVICTIETGALEHPDGLLNDFFQNKNKKHPKLWIRGFEPRYSPFRIYNNALDSICLFNKKVLDINSVWDCGWSYYPRQKKIERYCKGYVSEAMYNVLATLSLKEEFISEKNQLLFEHLGEKQDRIKNNDYVIISKKTQLKLSKNHCNFLYWEDFTSHYQWFWMISVEEQIKKLENILDKMEAELEAIIHLIPFCLEDEGVSYYKSIQSLKFKTITYLPNVFDFIDLKKTTNST